MKSDADIQPASRPIGALRETEIDSHATIRNLLRERREGLGITIREIEEAAGITVDYLAKFEKDDPTKIPNLQTTKEWAEALGVTLYARIGPLPPATLRVISDTREQIGRRKTMIRYWRARRASASQSEP